MQHARPVEDPSCSNAESATPGLGTLHRTIEDLLNELAYIDAYPERWDSQSARAVRRAVILTEIRWCRSMLPRMERRRLLS